MSDTEFTRWDYALISCLYDLKRAGTDRIEPAGLVPLLAEEFPGNDEIAMREGLSITRLRGRGLVDVDDDGRVGLTDEGEALGEGLERQV